MLKSPALIIIEWRDAVVDLGWRDHGDAEPAQVCWSIGVITDETDMHITIGGTWGIDSSGAVQTNNRVTIPKGWIISQGKVTIPKPKKEKPNAKPNVAV